MPNTYNQRSLPPKLPANKKTFFKQFLIGMGLILLITSLFFYKNNLKKHSADEKMQNIRQQSEQIEYVEVDLASPSEVAKAINDKKIQLIDIREQAEFELKHIESSINIPISTIGEDIDLLDKKLKVIIIDREDSPYGRVLTDHLKKEGVSAKYLEGGIVNYFNQDYPLITTGNPIYTEDLLKVTSITTDQLLEMVFDGKRIALIDTRPKESFQQGNIAGSINIPLEDVEKRKNEFPLKTMVLYDEDAIRSFQAAVRLYDLGFFEVYNCLDDYETLHRRLNEEVEKRNKTQEAPTP